MVGSQFFSCDGTIKSEQEIAVAPIRGKTFEISQNLKLLVKN